MKNTRHTWLIVSLVHPAVSAICIVLGSTISGWFGYSAALLAFLANLPGVMVIKQFHQSTPVDSTTAVDSFYFSMIGITWFFIVPPACYLSSRFLSNRAT